MIPWPMPAFVDFSDQLIDELIGERKLLARRINKKPKAAHIQWGWELTAADEPERTYSLFVRQAQADDALFSCGLQLVLPGRRLILCRYNGGYHRHRNRLGARERIAAQPHRHLARGEYLAKGFDGDAFAEPRSDFTTLEGALHALVTDCRITGVDTDPEQPGLPFGER